MPRYHVEVATQPMEIDAENEREAVLKAAALIKEGGIRLRATSMHEETRWVRSWEGSHRHEVQWDEVKG